MTDEAAFKETLKICLYGPYGAQKTLQIGHLINMIGKDRVAIVSAESGLSTIKSLVDPANVRVIHDVAGIGPVREWIEKEYNTPEHWVCWDGGSRIMSMIANEHFTNTDMAYNSIVRKQPVSPALMSYCRFISQRSDGPPGIDSQGIYGKIGRDSELLLNRWLGLGSNLLVNYLEDMTGTRNREKVPPFGPDVPGKVGLRAVMSSFDFVLRLDYNNKKKIEAITQPTPMYLARTREDRFAGVEIPATIEDFNLATFIQTLKERK